MTVAAFLGVIALFGAIVAWATWHRGADERQSVKGHQHTLETLRNVADRRAYPGRPPLGGSGSVPRRRRAPSPGPSRLARTGPARPSAKVEAGRQQSIVIVDDTLGAPLGHPEMRHPSRRGRALDRRARLTTTVTVIVVGGAIGTALALAPSPRPSKSALHGSSPGTTTGVSHRPRPIATAGRGSVISTVPAPEVTPTSSTAYSASYAVPSSPYTLVIDASALSWVMATQTATGKVVWTDTLPAGGSHALTVSGDVAVQLGAPSDTTVSIGGKSVQFPTGYRAPLVLTFHGPP